MSVLLAETGQILERILVLATTPAEVSRQFERLCLELSAEISPRPQFSLALNPAGPCRAWASFTLGQRSGQDLRLSLMGFSLSDGAPSAQALEICDAILLVADRDDASLENLLRPGLLSPELLQKPLFFVSSQDPSSLRLRALAEWTRRHFRQLQSQTTEKVGLFKEALEWALSF